MYATTVDRSAAMQTHVIPDVKQLLAMLAGTVHGVGSVCQWSAS